MWGRMGIEVWMLVLTLIGVVLVAAGMVAGGVWAVARISGALDSLTEKVGDLSASVKELDDKMDSHSERLAVLEGRGDTCCNA